MIDINTQLLKETIQEKGYKLKYIAEKMGLSSYGLDLKLSKRNEFKVSEVNKMIEILSLSEYEIQKIFFGNTDTKSEQKAVGE